MLKNFLLGLTGNTAIVLGNNNINIQDIQHAIININSLDIKEVQRALSEFWEHTKKRLYFVVYAKFDTDTLRHEWKPFGEQTILSIIQLCVRGLPQTKSVVWFIDENEDLDEDTTDELKVIAGDTILVFSTDSLHSSSLYTCFNHPQIGGCIAVPSLETTNYLGLGTLTRLRTKIDNIHRHKKTFQYALKHVETDDDIAENINNIITAYMGHTHQDTKNIGSNDTHSQTATKSIIQFQW